MLKLRGSDFMPANMDKGTTAVLAEWAAGFRLDDAPPAVIERMKALVLDLLRVITVGAPLPWSVAARRLALQLGGTGSSSLLLTGDRLDAGRAAFVNGAYAHACDLDDTHVGSMHHAGASILPAVIAIAEQEDAGGRALLEAAICGYEASLRIGLATQPSLFQRGFMATPTCGALGAALAVGKLLALAPKDLAGALGAAGAYAGGLAQFYHSGGITKRLNGARGAESGVMAALLTKEGIWGPRDILEGEAGFFRAFAGKSDPGKVTGDLGRGYRLMEVSTKIHAGAGRLQASVDAGLALGARYDLLPEQIADVEVGIPKVIQGRLTQLDPPDLQSAQLSVPFSLAMALVLGRSRGAQAALRREDYEAALGSPAARALSGRVRCVLDPEVEAGTNTEEVPSRVSLLLADGRAFVERVAHPRGSPHRVMNWEELAALFKDTVADALPAQAAARVLELVAGLDRGTRVREITGAFVAGPGWLEKNG
ncbi:MAG TPA: MmgE/PrpD family protein [Burkholderiales bacterium]|nr:MmgE/PrpD family protein [Burkholderiales bacterium]